MRPVPDPLGPGQESVWDYPRPPRVEQVDLRVTIELGGERVVDTRDVVRVLETSHPPVYYLPISAFADGTLSPAEGASFCEFKGAARYLDVHGGGRIAERAAWNYPDPSTGFEALRDRVAVYAGPMDACTIDGEQVTPQPGSFYGGWITSWVVGPFKGGPGSMGW
ncbi:uncharacterized protein (DUF427 family) [Agromyces flavus]|uniref:Uncharacterized conserved protein, DUF427 family n=1 Tax=Agromyces flavus TaxID=589382 RepID=A0A1H1LA68_9MICO|nr:DUF427 domain-containing protein [Agromyces flavus]MCP2367485.1 uncharacterized protein (DUF427 family) [Agromyces flavus]GGI45637.1 hypothetical protein GCM10010932_10550 [Agromyces flavus]SDR71250.1 Uncharacterized conserved protein, DUF427 family [Agromyces flavus]